MQGLKGKSYTAVAVFNPSVVSFRAFNVAEFVQSLMPLVMFALFIERVLEVFLASWRGQRTAELRERANFTKSKDNKSEARSPDKEALAQHKSQTQRIAFFAGTTLGVIVAALGIRVLELSVDPAVFAELPRVQQRLFRTTDVLMTGAVLGGGSDALHQLMLVFTNFFQSVVGRGGGSEVGVGRVLMNFLPGRGGFYNKCPKNVGACPKNALFILGLAVNIRCIRYESTPHRKV